MKTARIFLRLLLFVVIVAAAAAQPVRELLKRPEFRLYTVVFGVTVDEHGKMTRFRIAGVSDARSDSKALLPVKVPAAFTAAARKKLAADHPKPRFKDGKPAEFFTYYFYTPDYPNNLISDLYLPPANQP